MLRRLVTWSYDRRRRVVALWVAAVVAASVLAGVAGGDNETDFTVPGSNSAEAVELLQERFPRFAGGTVDVVYTADGGVAGPEVTDRVAGLADRIAEVDHVIATEPGPVSPDQTTGVLTVRFDEAGETLPSDVAERVMELAGEAEQDGLRIELGGYPIERAERQEAGSETVGLAAAVVILLVAFGSVLAAGVPLVVAGLGLGVALGGVWLMANVLEVPDFGVQLATMIGIGVGIDYALFVVTRFRAALDDGHEPRQAVITAGATAGRAVVFAGTAVVISLGGLLFMGRDYLWGVALATCLTVLVVVAASVTVLPALLGFAGRNIDRLRLPWFRHGNSGRRTLSWRWSRVVQRRPLLAGLAALATLLALAAPALDLRLGNPDAGNGPTNFTSRRAYDLMSDSFGTGANGPSSWPSTSATVMPRARCRRSTASSPASKRPTVSPRSSLRSSTTPGTRPSSRSCRRPARRRRARRTWSTRCATTSCRPHSAAPAPTRRWVARPPRSSTTASTPPAGSRGSSSGSWPCPSCCSRWRSAHWPSPSRRR